jgi:hypothetical protein
MASVRRRSYAPTFLVLAWAYCTGMMSSSFWGQLEEMLRGVDTEPNNLVVIFFKGAMWCVCVTSLALAFHHRSAQI